MKVENRSWTMSCPEAPSLSTEEAYEIISHIDNVRNLLQNYVQRTQGEEAQTRKKSWWARHCWPNKRRVLYRFVTIITIIFQLLNLTILAIIDTWPRRKSQDERDFLDASATTMIIIQLVNLVIIILASGRLMKQIYRHSVNGLFLAQSYIATILLFAGIYTLTYRLHKLSWKFVTEDLNENAVQGFILYAKFLFYSISTATLCGSDNVLPVEWYNCIFAGIQMLLSFCYFASILGSAITFTHDSGHLSPSAHSHKSTDTESLQQQHEQQQQQQHQQQQQNNSKEKQSYLTRREKHLQRTDSEIVLIDTDSETTYLTNVCIDPAFRDAGACNYVTQASPISENQTLPSLAFVQCHPSLQTTTSIGSEPRRDNNNDVTRTGYHYRMTTTEPTIHNVNFSNMDSQNSACSDTALLLA